MVDIYLYFKYHIVQRLKPGKNPTVELMDFTIYKKVTKE